MVIGANMKKCSLTIIVLIVTILLASFVACNNDSSHIDYTITNNFEVKISTVEQSQDENGNIHYGYTIYEPVLTNTPYSSADYGLVFYLGTGIKAEYYEYIGTALAQQGYIVMFYNALFSYAHYQTVERAFTMYSNVRFFVGGHSQGGAAAIRRAMECSNLMGAVLLDPMALRHQALDENGNAIKDENGIDIYINDSLKDTSIPALYIKCDDQTILTDAMRAEALSRMNDAVIVHNIDDGTHTNFAHTDTSAQQESEVLTCILAFMQSVILG